jgi:hypothetical protein
MEGDEQKDVICCTGDTRNALRVLVVSRHVGDQVAEGSVWTGFLWSRMGFYD